MISWKVTNADFDALVAIARRAYPGTDSDYRRTLMDLNACHANGNPLDLIGLLTADEGNFWHDIGGISRHIDRETGKLKDCFTPRYTWDGKA